MYSFVFILVSELALWRWQIHIWGEEKMMNTERQIRAEPWGLRCDFMWLSPNMVHRDLLRVWPGHTSTQTLLEGHLTLCRSAWSSCPQPGPHHGLSTEPGLECCPNSKPQQTLLHPMACILLRLLDSYRRNARSGRVTVNYFPSRNIWKFSSLC